MKIEKFLARGENRLPRDTKVYWIPGHLSAWFVQQLFFEHAVREQKRAARKAKRKAK